MKRSLLVLFMLALALSLAFAGAKQEPVEETPTETKEEPAPAAAARVIKNPDTFIFAGAGDPQSLDPARAYDNVASQVMNSIYESLIDYDGPETGTFIARLAVAVPTVANGGISADGMTYRFKVRSGVKFHSGHTLTAEDVEYTFERNLVLDPDGGPNWMFYQYLLGKGGSKDGDGNFAVTFAEIDKAIEVDGDYAVFNLPTPFPPFLSLMANTYGVVVSKQFAIENGDWDGTEATWKDFNKPEIGTEALHEVANGTGPYKLVRWTKEDEIVLERFDGYWGPKPAMAKGIRKNVKEWSTRKLMFLQGDVDAAGVDGDYWPDMEKESGLTILKGLPSLGVSAFFFTYDINVADNPLVGSGKLDGEGIPADFFADKNIRLAFVHAWDEDTFLEDVYRGEAIDPVTPVSRGLPFKDESLKSYPHDMAKAEDYFKKAFDGQVWDKGFQMEILYNAGNEARQTVANILAENIMSLSPKFKITTRGVEWSEYLGMIINTTMPLFVVGWGPDYPDPDNFVYPFMHSNGTFSGWAKYSNPEVDKLIEEAGVELDSAKRQAIYYKLQKIYVDDVVSRACYQVLTRRHMRDWVKGADFYNPVKSDIFNHLRLITKE